MLEKQMETKMKFSALVLTGSILFASASSQADEVLSDKQEGALYGAAGVLLLQNFARIRGYTSGGYPTAGGYPTSPGYYPPADPAQRAYEQGVRDRQRMETQERASRAYNCGRYGTDCDTTYRGY